MADPPPGTGVPDAAGHQQDPAAKAQAASAQAVALPPDKLGTVAECPIAAAARKKLETDRKLKELADNGHGPQRHEGDVTPQQLVDRAVHGHDPMTGSATDGVTGGEHKYGRHATKINTPQDYVEAEEKMRASAKFKDELKAREASGETTIVVDQQPLQDILGPDYEKKVSGKTRVGSKNHPTGSTDTVFTGGTMKAVYDKDSNGKWQLTTMYPDPPGPA